MKEICVNCWVFCIFTGHILSVNIIFYVAGSIFRTTLQALRVSKISPFSNTFFAKMKYTQCKTKQKNVNKIDPTKLRIEFRFFPFDHDSHIHGQVTYWWLFMMKDIVRHILFSLPLSDHIPLLLFFFKLKLNFAR